MQKHSLRLARLEWELTQRKNLAHLCKSLVEEQKKLGQGKFNQQKMSIFLLNVFLFQILLKEKIS